MSDKGAKQRKRETRVRMCFHAEAIKFVECGWLPDHGNKPPGS